MRLGFRYRLSKNFTLYDSVRLTGGGGGKRPRQDEDPAAKSCAGCIIIVVVTAMIFVWIWRH